MYVECYDEQGAQAYDTILRYTLQELKLAKAIEIGRASCRERV